jgi:hypothetical protein
MERVFNDRAEGPCRQVLRRWPGGLEPGRRYSPQAFVKATKEAKCGNLDLALCSTSIVERSNVRIRVCNRRFKRLTRLHKKMANHAHVHSFVKIHRSNHTTLLTLLEHGRHRVHGRDERLGGSE